LEELLDQMSKLLILDDNITMAINVDVRRWNIPFYIHHGLSAIPEGVLI
jgi:hypothetical protein